MAVEPVPAPGLPCDIWRVAAGALTREEFERLVRRCAEDTPAAMREMARKAQRRLFDFMRTSWEARCQAEKATGYGAPPNT